MSHAILSPSSASRWLQCPASIRMSEGTVDTRNRAGELGTACHLIAEMRLARLLSLDTDFEAAQAELDRLVLEWSVTDSEFRRLTDMAAEYSDYVQAELKPGDVVAVEQRVETGIDGAYGTADCVIVSGDTVRIIDLKSGRVAVGAKDNPQLKLYAVGVLDEFGDENTKRVFWTVHQPSIGRVESDGCTADDLRAWREEIRPVAAGALDGTGGFGPSESACTFCPARGSCRPRTDAIISADFTAAPVGDRMSDAELSGALGRVGELRSWADDVELEAVTRATKLRRNIPGYKVVRGPGRRVIVDREAAVAALEAAGITEESYLAPRKFLTVGVLGTLLSDEGLDMEEVLGGSMGRSEGKPKLVPTSDPREIEDAASDFK